MVERNEEYVKRFSIENLDKCLDLYKSQLKPTFDNQKDNSVK
jgi:hypothetical protein